MKKILALGYLFIAIPLFADDINDLADDLYSQIPKDLRKQSMAVLQFKNVDLSEQIEVYVKEELTKELVHMGASVMERDQIDKLLAEKIDQSTGLFSNESAANAVAGLGAKTVLIGTITLIENDTYQINIKLVEIATYKIIAASSIELEKKFPKIVKQTENNSTSRDVQSLKSENDGFPTLFEIYAGGGSMKYSSSESLGSIDDGSTPFVGLRFTSIINNYFSSAFELSYMRVNGDIGIEYKEYQEEYPQEYYVEYYDRINIHFVQFGWIPSLRYSLSQLSSFFNPTTDVHIGYSMGIGIDRLTKSSVLGGYSYGFWSGLTGGVRYGITDSFSIFGEFRHYPSIFNYLRRSSSSEDISGTLFYAGLGFTM